jgi:hypothetical protein
MLTVARPTGKCCCGARCEFVGIFIVVTTVLKRVRSTTVVLAAMATSACQERPPGVYDLSITEAYQRLFRHTLPDLVFAKQCGILIHVRPEGVPNQRVTWRVYSSGQKVVEFSAVLTAIGDRQTKIVIDMPRGDKSGEAYDGSQFYVRPAFNQPLRPAVEEQVAAILESRAFDVRRVGPGTDKVCHVQRGGLESGRVFRVDDVPGMDARQSADCRERRRPSGQC